MEIKNYISGYNAVSAVVCLMVPSQDVANCAQGAIFASVGITAIQLPNLDATHWTARARSPVIQYGARHYRSGILHVSAARSRATEESFQHPTVAQPRQGAA